MKDFVECPQRKTMIIPFIITVTAGVPAMTEGGTYLAVADGAAGVYAVTFTSTCGASSRTPVITATPSGATTDDWMIAIVTPTTAGFTLETSDNAGTLAEAKVIHGIVVWFGSVDAR